MFQQLHARSLGNCCPSPYVVALHVFGLTRLLFFARQHRERDCQPQNNRETRTDTNDEETQVQRNHERLTVTRVVGELIGSVLPGFGAILYTCVYLRDCFGFTPETKHNINTRKESPTTKGEDKCPLAETCWRCYCKHCCCWLLCSILVQTSARCYPNARNRY